MEQTLEMDRHIWFEQATTLTYRLAVYAMQNLMDDAAMLALMFC